MEGRLKRRQEGFTFVELAMVIVIISIIGGILYQIIATSTDAWAFLSSRQEMVQDGRAAMLRMVREIRGAETIFGAESRRMIFSNRNERIYYRWSGISGDPLEEQKMPPSMAFYPLAANVGDFEFEYWSIDGTSPMIPPVLNDICRVLIKLRLQKGQESYYLESQVYLRNFQ